MRTTNEAIAWLRADRKSGSRAWRGLCQMRVRSARGIPAVYPSAFAAMVATPMSERVYNLDKITRGMVGYADDPNDSNKYGHVFTFVGRTKDDNTLLVDTNDALILGGGSVVRYDWFASHWGDRFQFAGTSINGFDLDLPDVKKKNDHPEPQSEPTTGNLDYAIHRLGKAVAWHEKQGHKVVAARIRQEIADLREIRKVLRK